MVTLDRIDKALKKVAALVAVDASFLPVFEKLENEREALVSNALALERAKSLVNSAKVQSAIGASKLAA